jgi:hypothetical protein
MIEESRKQVEERIEFIKTLYSLRDEFKGPDKIQITGNNSWTHPYKHFDGLLYYLLLTCFDILGQNGTFIDFSSWLESKEKLEEREKIFKQYPATQDNRYLSAIYKEYNNIYGVKRAFFNFIEKIMSPENRLKLHDSIKIVKYDKFEIKIEDFRPTAKQKNEFLFQIRNSFTHKGVSTGSEMPGIFPDYGVIGNKNTSKDRGYYAIRREKKADYILIYGVKNWPQLLWGIVESTLS